MRVVPVAVRCILRDEASDEILRSLYETMVRPCVQLLKQGKIAQAKELYLESYRALCKRYGL